MFLENWVEYSNGAEPAFRKFTCSPVQFCKRNQLAVDFMCLSELSPACLASHEYLLSYIRKGFHQVRKTAFISDSIIFEEYDAGDYFGSSEQAPRAGSFPP